MDAETKALVKFQKKAAIYFTSRPTHGEDMAHQANVANAENCRKTADLIERLEAEKTEAEASLWRVFPNTHTVFVDEYPLSKNPDPFEGKGETYKQAYERLAGENVRLREALEPFARVAELDIGTDEEGEDIFWPMSNARYSMAGRLRVKHLRRARAALDGEVGR
jgi:hypothetical protein